MVLELLKTYCVAITVLNIVGPVISWAVVWCYLKLNGQRTPSLRIGFLKTRK